MKKFTWIPVLSLAATLFTTGVAHATDPALIVAALPNENAVCRYVTQFMEKRRNTGKEMRSLMANVSKAKTPEQKRQWTATKGELLERDNQEAATSDELIMVIDAKYPHLVCPQ